MRRYEALEKKRHGIHATEPERVALLACEVPCQVLYRAATSSEIAARLGHQSNAIIVSAELTSTPGPSSTLIWVITPLSTIMA